MLIEHTGAGFYNVHPEDHICASYVRFGLGTISYVVAGERRQTTQMEKPHTDYTIGELHSHLLRLRNLCTLMRV